MTIRPEWTPRPRLDIPPEGREGWGVPTVGGNWVIHSTYFSPRARRVRVLAADRAEELIQMEERSDEEG